MPKDTTIIETDLTEEEKAIIKAGWEEYEKGGFVPLESILPRPTSTD